MTLISRDEVKNKLGIPMSNLFEDAAIDEAIDAAYSWLAAVKPLVDWTAPSPHQRLGVVWLVSRLYQSMEGTDDEAANIDVGGIVFLLGRQAQELLGLGYYNDPVVA